MEPLDTRRKQRPSISDVATAAGVSKGAVSKVIRNAYGVSPSMRQRVEQAIEDLDYRPRTSARVMRGASFTLGFEMPQIGNDFFTLIMQGAAAELENSGYQLIIAAGSGPSKGETVLNALTDRQVDGVIAISPEVTPAWLETLGEEVPTVLVGRHDASVNYDTLNNDDRLGATMVMDHLLALGHEHIAHITVHIAENVPADLLPHPIRRGVYDSAMRERNLPTTVVTSGPFEPEAFEVSKRLLTDQPRPTAIFAGNDTLAIGAMRARAELGISPDELSIAGYDNIDLAANPIISLTTVDQFGIRSGHKAVQMLMERIQGGRQNAAHHQITPELRIRNSTRSAPRAAGLLPLQEAGLPNFPQGLSASSASQG